MHRALNNTTPTENCCPPEMNMGLHHHDERYQRWGRQLRAAATADPSAVCWRGGHTMQVHQQLHPGRRLTWTAGHTQQGSITWQPWTAITAVPPAGDWLAPEVSSCNYKHNQRRANPTSRPVWNGCGA